MVNGSLHNCYTRCVINTSLGTIGDVSETFYKVYASPEGGYRVTGGWSVTNIQVSQIFGGIKKNIIILLFCEWYTKLQLYVLIERTVL